MATNEFDWVPFYKEFAEKLLGYKDNRQELIEIIKDVYTTIGIKLPKLERDFDVVDVDPFTVFGLFNKQITNDNRKKIIGGFIKKLSLKNKIPNEFNGIPVLDNRNATFYEFLPKRGSDVIDAFWELFNAALAYAKNKTQDNREKVKEWFDVAVNKKYNGTGKMTIGLYWIAPDCYLNLDSVNIDFIYKFQGLPASVVESLPAVPSKISSALYFEILTKISDYLNTEDSEYKSFYEISYQAWIKSTNPGPVNPPEVPKEEPKGQKSKNYWFLSANPKLWSMSSLPEGDVQDYTLYNENGNKRRIFQNFLDAKAGDMVIGYESFPEQKIVALMRIYEENDGESLYFEKLEALNNPIDYAMLKSCPELQNMQYFVNPQGSLFKLTKEEYECICDLIRKSNPETSEPPKDAYTKADFLEEVFMSEAKYDRLVAVLSRKQNIILQGAPGVGKTFAAKRLAYSIMGKIDKEHVEFIQFHQNYSYEDFILGYKPKDDGFKLKEGVFYKFCQKAAECPGEKFFFIIDEINRGNMSKIFGELLMLIEKDYRGEEITLAYDDLKFTVPENLYIIGLMNTADRSLAMIDYALRRRFSFFEMEPGFATKGFKSYQGSLNNDTFDKLIACTVRLNERIAGDKSLGKGFCIGHGYFCKKKDEPCTIDWMKDIVEFEILPMLQEYWFDDDKKVEEWQEEFEEVFE